MKLPGFKHKLDRHLGDKSGYKYKLQLSSPLSSVSELNLLEHQVQVQYSLHYKQMWFISGLRSLFSKWPASSAVSVLSCELNSQGSRPAWAIFSG